MSLRPLANMFVKLLGLYTGLQSLNALQMTWAPLSYLLSHSGHGLAMLDSDMFESSLSWTAILPGLVTGVAQIAAGTYLWRHSQQISNAIVGDEEASASHGNWQRVAFGAVGAYLIADSFCRVVLALLLPADDQASKVNSLVTPILISSFVRAMLGIWLWLGAKGIARVMKNIGRDSEVEVTHES